MAGGLNHGLAQCTHYYQSAILGLIIAFGFVGLGPGVFGFRQGDLLYHLQHTTQHLLFESRLARGIYLAHRTFVIWDYAALFCAVDLQGDLRLKNRQTSYIPHYYWHAFLDAHHHFYQRVAPGKCQVLISSDLVCGGLLLFNGWNIQKGERGVPFLLALWIFFKVYIPNTLKRIRIDILLCHWTII